jgi:hypothetical protein
MEIRKILPNLKCCLHGRPEENHERKTQYLGRRFQRQILKSWLLNKAMTFGSKQKDHTYLLWDVFVCMFITDIYHTQNKRRFILITFPLSSLLLQHCSLILHSSNEFYYTVGIHKNTATVLTPVGNTIRYRNSTVLTLVLLLLGISIINCPNSGDRSFCCVGFESRH